MSKHTHTPGPWFVDPRRALRVRTADDETVASTGTTDGQREHWEANARLTAAAPELLAALIRLVAEDEADAPYARDSLKQARAAIRKATGEPK